jgi:hypothetical protein
MIAKRLFEMPSKVLSSCIHSEIKGAIMANMSIRGLDDKTLSKLKRVAKQNGTSLNSFVVHLLQNNGTPKLTSLKKFDDLDALAGTWNAKEAQVFERNTAAFAEVDPALWK